MAGHLRPLLHFTPPTQWMNDPNGMVYYDGEYHLFYQYHPDSTVWGPMHWGHAVSSDLVNWQHLPIALYPDELGYIFSGSAIVDWHNSAGFGNEAMVAFFTYHNPANALQSQALAYSTDRGRSWTKFDGNPVIPTPPNVRDFRDPKVVWYENDNGVGHWVMVIAAGSSIIFYTSQDLRNWEPVSTFGLGEGATSSIWETPDIFCLPVEDGPDWRWVLAVGVGDDGPALGTAVQYFVGSFDGETFRNDNEKETVLWADYGADFYAAQSWSDAPNGRRLWLAWMNNWRYARVIPTSTWRGAMTLPRELALSQTPDGVRLWQRPVPELKKLRDKDCSWKDVVLRPDEPFVPEIEGTMFEIIATFQSASGSARFGIGVEDSAGGYVTVGYSAKNGHLFIDRAHTTNIDFHPDFGGVHTALYVIAGNTICFHLFVDSSALELFIDDGALTFSECFFPAEGGFKLLFFSENDVVFLQSLQIYTLRPANFSLLDTAVSTATFANSVAPNNSIKNPTNGSKV